MATTHHQVSTGLARSRDQDDFAACSFIDHFQGNFPVLAHRHRVARIIASAQIYPLSLFTAAFSGPRNSSPPCNAHSCGTTVPGGLVQYVFSPPARIKSLHATDLSWPRRCAKNALHYAMHRITTGW